MTGMFFRAQEISKSFPGVKANDRVDFEMATGEIHALFGENGSGKSTLVKTIYGLAQPDEGRMWLRGEDYMPRSPQQARAKGVTMVFQHFSLFDAMSVAENIALGMDQPPPRARLSEMIANTGERYGLPLSPDSRVGDLSVGERQRVEIIRCLLQDPDLLIMDEPTSVLTPQEVDTLFATLRQLVAEGTAILYISHKLEEIRELCDRATILRGGRVVAKCDPKEKSARELAELMVGRSFSAPARAASATEGELLLEASGLSLPPVSVFGTGLTGVSFSVRAGEVLGIAGVAGNGQEELAAALSGESRASGSLRLDGVELQGKGINERRRLGLSAAPEERLGHSAAPDMSLTENAYLTAAVRMRLSPGGIVDWSAARSFAESVMHSFDVRAAGPFSAARALSGGNLQKFVIGREILQTPRALVVNQPTWGVDAAAASVIRQALLDMAEDGAAIVVISQDLDELIEISSTIAVLNGGRLSEQLRVENVTRDELGLLMGGAKGLREVADAAA
ncbi:MAG: ABC transporter ATP-binding protein [Rhodobacteraceae bacterium]|nr:ABC transporter ATP-binding protein [Paracoccaceae bacterium]